eukprot:CAMPEP_0118807904 /NCGR_PEP_ID=MMETSP1161-20130426/35713_1 /TAXON_ID=249345 /ORGANISM="Picochlorum oklahomensis, Strain CCMP2329" /LENGTH=623 /DNA_ID=CAMNT_0006737289 /DNA_START=18 /DNA_END=1889 /DNA_ORIENTATION=+
MGGKPVWPEGDDGVLLNDILIEKSIQDVFIMIHGGLTEYRKHLEDLCKHENFCFYGWKASEEELESAAPCTTLVQSLSEVKQGMVAKKSFDAPGGMGQKYKTVERMALRELDPGKKVLIESCVSTKAPYGDKFNVLLRHCFESQDKSLVQMTVRCVIVYHAKINGMIKGMIEKGSKEGMQKSQEKAALVLKKFVPIRKSTKEEPEKKKPVVPLIMRNHMEVLFGKTLIARLEPWAYLAHAFLEQVQFMSCFTPTRIMLVCLTMLSVYMTHILISILGTLKRGSENPSDPLATILHSFFSVLYVPKCTHEVVCSFLLLYLIRFVLGLFAKVLPQTGACQANAEECSVYGVKYDGYRKAMQNATPQYVGIDARSEFALAQIGKGLDFVAKGLKKNHKVQQKTIKNLAKKATKGHVLGKKEHKAKCHKEMAAETIEEHPPSSSPITEEEQSDTTPPPEESDVALDPTKYTPPDLPHSIMEGAVVEEVFENERHQPFRGFGSTWPGHFLPTDKVHRWTVRKANPSGIYSSQTMTKVVPHLAQGWVWIEPAWSIDLSGLSSHSTDDQGWSYGLDFPKSITYPFPPGTGKKKMSDFVRTRRWLRTRIEASKLADASPSHADEIQPENHR